MTAVPMSGDANRDDPTARVQWSFDLPAPAPSCAVSVYVPKTGVTRDAAGHPAFYDVAGSVGGAPVGTFTVDQLDSQGSWVAAGTFVVGTGTLVLTLHTRGVDFDASGPTLAHLAAAQVQVLCTARG
jgi:translation initiation factor IF-2